MSELTVRSKNGLDIFVSSRVASLFPKELTPELLREAVRLTEIPWKIMARSSRPLRFTVDLGRVIGTAGVVETASIDKDMPALFAIREGKKRATHVIMKKFQPATSSLTFVVVPCSRTTLSDYKLIVAYTGFAAEKEPWDPNIDTDEEREIALRFWLSHAMIYGLYPMGEPFTSTWREILK